MNVGIIIQIIITLVAVGVSWGSLHSSVRNIQKILDKEIKPDLKNIRERFAVTEDRMDTLWKERGVTGRRPVARVAIKDAVV